MTIRDCMCVFKSVFCMHLEGLWGGSHIGKVWLGSGPVSLRNITANRVGCSGAVAVKEF